MNPSLIQNYFFLHKRYSIHQESKNCEIEILHENENLTILLTMAWRLDGRGGRPEEMGGRPRKPDPRADIAHKTSSEEKILKLRNLKNFKV